MEFPIKHYQMSSTGLRILKDWLHNEAADWYTPDDDAIQNITLLCEAYHVSNFLEISPHFLDEVMDLIVNAVTGEGARSGEEIKTIIVAVRRAGPIGTKFLTDWLVHSDMTEVTIEDKQDAEVARLIESDSLLRPQFLEAMMRERIAKTNKYPWADERCKYHVHGEHIRCYAKWV